MEFNGDDESSFEQCYRCYPVTFIEKVRFFFKYHVFMMNEKKHSNFRNFFFYKCRHILTRVTKVSFTLSSVSLR